MLQAGDPKGAEREFTALLKTTPAFYPAETGLGFALLAEKQYKPAAAHFTAALAKNDRYVPALQGQASAELAQGDDGGRDRRARAHPRDRSEAGDGAEPSGAAALPASAVAHRGRPEGA